ncbi:ScbA/BarX family gamma-butyrolactone biosynthesis protein [Streptomyces sp. NPDC002870]|uniref:ScbA/BarX family gamma-butyrolactone biosynthesis protein n=1 Tax=Streptomyces sp. NPDC002870 TaxID=3364666 RepID=UPI0036CB882E
MTTTTLSLDDHTPEDAELTYTRTVDRALVHRDSLGEVFLTDLRPLSDTCYAAAAQLPRSHAYYGDHLLRPSAYDPVLLLEACRQSCLAGAHEFYGVPAGHKFILTHLRIQLTRLERIAVGTAPCALSMRVTVVAHRRREGRTTGLDYEIGLFVGRIEIGTASVGLRFKSPEDYVELRLKNRGGMPLPSSGTHEDTNPARAVDPYLVGRTNPRNVVLADAVAEDDTATAVLRIPGDHPSMFDHPQDHLPGMVIAEAARQIALLTALEARGMSPSKTLPTALSVVFSQFGELEKTTVITSQVGEERQAPADDEHVYYTQGGTLELDPAASASAGRLPVRVVAAQDGETLCVFSLTLSRVGFRS